MSVVRLKYRQPAIHPELSNPTENVSLSVGNRIKPPEDDSLTSAPAVRHDTPIYLATHTQMKRVEVYVSSDEEKYRRAHYPTIHERLELQKDWAKQQLTEAKVAYEREALKKMLEEKVRARVTGEEEKDVDEDDVVVVEEEEEMVDGELTQTDASYALELMGIKERKLLATRNTAVFHKDMSKFEVKKLAFRTTMGWLGKTDKTLTVVLPWLLLGRRETSSNLHLLLKLGITHILNVTHDLPNMFSNHFVYQRLGVKDSSDEDIGSRFSAAINFIRRVEECRGRVLVHCTAGASRAPSIVLAFLVFAKKLPLVDAYNYLTAIRPLVAPNKHFLFQLAMLEVQYGEGCSVYFHKEWRFYEFNTFRAVGVEERRSLGMFRAVVQLYTKQREEDDLVG